MDKYRDEFDPETLQILTRAFDLAWRYLQQVLTNAGEGDRERLAEVVMQIGRSGELKTIRVANLAVERFSKEADGRLRFTRVEERPPESVGVSQLQGGA